MSAGAATEPNAWVRPVVVGWQVFMGVFGAWGWLAGAGYAPPGVVSAVVSIASAAILMNASVQLRRAEAKKRRRSIAVWGAALVLFGLWSGYSAHHAFEVSQGGAIAIDSLLSLEAVNALFLFVFFAASAWIDPLLMWAVEDTERAATPAPAEPVATPAPPRREATGRRRLNLVEAAAFAGVSALAPTAATAALPSQPAPQTRTTDASRAVSPDDIRRACRELDARGLRPSYRTVARHLGVPVSRIERAWTPGVPLAA